MGTYLNPGYAGFDRILRGKYMDKTGMIRWVNASFQGPDNLICVSRPRRFGKSYAAKMLCAYYDHSCNSRWLFDDKDISKDESYLVHLNQYHVVNLDITGFISSVKRQNKPIRQVPELIVKALYDEICSIYPDIAREKTLAQSFLRCAEETGRRFIFIIDEWDALIREAKNDPGTQEAYLNLLREWFKNNNFTPQVVAGAYMTGILPIKKDGSQSAISDFIEYPILFPGEFTPYTGFTENEVKALCHEYDMSFQEAKLWYDGYDFNEYGSIYNPYSVMSAMKAKKFRSYWKRTSAAESLITYINMDEEGLQEMVARLISGEEVEVNVEGFENDMESFHSRDDVLTLLIHLGYLTYHEDDKTVHIPNEEVRVEFHNIISSRKINQSWIELIQTSRKLLKDTLSCNEEAVAAAIEKVRESEYAPTFYNNEQALRYVIKFAYIAGIDQYAKVEELPSGKGIADVVYIPKARSFSPAILIELKWNKTAGGAISQIHEKKYPAVLKSFGGDIVLVGINYNEKTREHSCRIETVIKE